MQAGNHLYLRHRSRHLVVHLHHLLPLLPGRAPLMRTTSVRRPLSPSSSPTPSPDVTEHRYAVAQHECRGEHRSRSVTDERRQSGPIQSAKPSNSGDLADVDPVPSKNLASAVARRSLTKSGSGRCRCPPCTVPWTASAIANLNLKRCAGSALAPVTQLAFSDVAHWSTLCCGCRFGRLSCCMRFRAAQCRQ